MASSSTPGEPSRTAPSSTADAPSTSAYTYDEIREGSTIPHRTWVTRTNPEFWDRQVDPYNDPSDIQLTTYFARVMMDIINLNLRGEVMMSTLYNDFEGWTEVQFEKVDRVFQKEIVKKVRRGELDPVVFKLLRLSQGVEAHELLVSGSSVKGKMMFIVDADLAAEHGI